MYIFLCLFHLLVIVGVLIACNSVFDQCNEQAGEGDRNREDIDPH